MNIIFRSLDALVYGLILWIRTKVSGAGSIPMKNIFGHYFDIGAHPVSLEIWLATGLY